MLLFYIPEVLEVACFHCVNFSLNKTLYFYCYLPFWIPVQVEVTHKTKQQSSWNQCNLFDLFNKPGFAYSYLVLGLLLWHKHFSTSSPREQPVMTSISGGEFHSSAWTYSTCKDLIACVNVCVGSFSNYSNNFVRAADKSAYLLIFQLQ